MGASVCCYTQKRTLLHVKILIMFQNDGGVVACTVTVLYALFKRELATLVVTSRPANPPVPIFHLEGESPTLYQSTVTPYFMLTEVSAFQRKGSISIVRRKA